MYAFDKNSLRNFEIYATYQLKINSMLSQGNACEVSDVRFLFETI